MKFIAPPFCFSFIERVICWRRSSAAMLTGMTARLGVSPLTLSRALKTVP
ncbi:hypothetical protein [Rhodobium gokarnense]|uniref:Uncharacterized protein n=1 Tax=Rhodobium gokarnense TaxID=364296 RepID=A0ABT3HEX7_9HYPH|nr:hypothetical protein [Rhodobium gokarnense]MCW2308949.1 hypothetical protein [Rhodobium gokarnense]